MSVAFTPHGQAHVECTAPIAGQRLLSITAPDQVGLLWAMCRWLADHGLSIEAAHVDERDGRAHDRFVITGDADVSGLRTHLSAPRRGLVSAIVARFRGRDPRPSP